MYQTLNNGFLEIIVGGMYAGKSSELIRRIIALSYNKNNHIIAFKPAIDDRYDKSKISTHIGQKYEAYAINDYKEISKYLKDRTNIVAVDEVQFFNIGIVDYLDSLADRGVRVICAGLDMDFARRPFPVTASLLAKAELITKLSATCVKCGKSACYSQRLVNGKPVSEDSPIVQVGGKESYIAVCRKCYQKAVSNMLG